LQSEEDIGGSALISGLPTPVQKGPAKTKRRNHQAQVDNRARKTVNTEYLDRQPPGEHDQPNKKNTSPDEICQEVPGNRTDNSASKISHLT
jgi:hypothetical protein